MITGYWPAADIDDRITGGSLHGAHSWRHTDKGGKRLTFAQRSLRQVIGNPMMTSHKNVAVGIPVTGYPPHRSRRARFTHRAPASGVWR